MTPWWNEGAAIWIGAVGGGGLGSLAGIYGGLVGLLAPRGIGRGPMLAFHVAMVALGVVSLVAGLVALIAGQPYHVWYPLGLIGLILTFVMGGLLPVVIIRYRQADVRKLEAAEIRNA